MTAEKKHIELEFRGDHIRVVLEQGFEVLPEQQEEFWSSVKQACEEFDCRRVLVEGYAPKRDFAASEVVELGVQASEAVPELWMALCLRDHDVSDLSELFKTVARSHGVHVKYFTDRGHALQWLRGNLSNQPTGRLA